METPLQLNLSNFQIDKTRNQNISLVLVLLFCVGTVILSWSQFSSFTSFIHCQHFLFVILSWKVLQIIKQYYQKWSLIISSRHLTPNFLIHSMKKELFLKTYWQIQSTAYRCTTKMYFLTLFSTFIQRDD